MALLLVYTPAHTLYAFHEADVESAIEDAKGTSMRP